MKYFDSNIKINAFSLIELSIVLIIIGLLVAGVTGGASLIESAKRQAFINETTNYKQAFFAFIASKGRLPGDLNDDKYIGYCVGLGCPGVVSKAAGGAAESYVAGKFPTPYNTTAIDYRAAPFVDLYLEKVIDFEPAKNNGATAGVNVPKSKSYSDTFFSFYTFGSFVDPRTGYFTNNIKPFSVSLFTDLSGTTGRKSMAKIYKNIDIKIDDGIFNTGKVRGYCVTTAKVLGTASYIEAEQDTTASGYCQGIHYIIK